jgi:hypothetical protein
VRQPARRGQPHAVQLLAHFRERDLAFLVRPADHQPRGKLEQAGGQAHALGGVEHRSRPAQPARFLAARAVEIRRGPLHQGHALAEDRIELVGGGEALAERDGDAAVGRAFAAFD